MCFSQSQWQMAVLKSPHINLDYRNISSQVRSQLWEEKVLVQIDNGAKSHVRVKKHLCLDVSRLVDNTGSIFTRRIYWLSSKTKRCSPHGSLLLQGVEKNKSSDKWSLSYKRFLVGQKRASWWQKISSACILTQLVQQCRWINLHSVEVHKHTFQLYASSSCKCICQHSSFDNLSTHASHATIFADLVSSCLLFFGPFL